MEYPAPRPDRGGGHEDGGALGRLDILVNNAGLGPSTPAEAVTRRNST